MTSLTTFAPPGSGPIQPGTFIVQSDGPNRRSGNGNGPDRAVILPDGARARTFDGWAVVDNVGLDGADLPRLAAWLRCRDLWLAAIQRRSGSLRSAHEYRRIWTSFFAASATSHGCELLPWDVNATHAQSWAVQLSGTLAPASVNKSLSVLSSFYRFAARQFHDGARLYLAENPFIGENLRAPVNRHGRARYPDTDQVLAICGAIAPTPLGLRDYCLIRGMFETTRRLSEWLNLRWQDIAGHTPTHAFHCRLKGGDDNWQELPAGLYAQLQAYLAAAHHWPPQPDDHLFVRLLPRPDWGRPLNAGYVRRMLRHYGRLAGVPEACCHPHGLRHAGARYRHQQGATNFELQKILGHRNIATTEIYTREVLERPFDRLGSTVDALFADARIPCSRV